MHLRGFVKSQFGELGCTFCYLKILSFLSAVSTTDELNQRSLVEVFMVDFLLLDTVRATKTLLAKSSLRIQTFMGCAAVSKNVIGLNFITCFFKRCYVRL